MTSKKKKKQYGNVKKTRKKYQLDTILTILLII